MEKRFVATLSRSQGRSAWAVTRRVRVERMPEWQSAFNESGRGSSFVRASIIGESIYDRAAPIPDVIPSRDRNSFLHDVAAIVERVCAEAGAILS
jgi:hypothetical protein